MGFSDANDIFLERMILAVRQAGVVARSLEGLMQNEGKPALPLPQDSEYTLAQRSAKTRVDDIIQEILLLAAAGIVDRDRVVLDAEEATPTARLFGATSGSLSLVMDPLDGTLAYLSRRDRYSINVGLVFDGKVAIAIVYFPARDTLYFLAPDGQSYVVRGASESGVTGAQLLEADRIPAQPVIYKNGRVPGEIVQLLTEQGYTVIDDSEGSLGCPDAILRCLTGEATAYISHTPQVRDILLGAIVGAVDCGYALDWHGNELSWPVSGRIPRVLVGCGTPAQNLLSCLTGDPKSVSRL